MVFVGYGIDAPDENWNDYAGVDVKGKVIVMMVNDPKPTAQEPNRFGGKSLTWYGRWIYKFEEAVRQGAAGVLLIHTTESASYPWSVPANGFAREQFRLAGKGNAMQGWIHEDTARSLFAAGGHDLDALRAKAEVRGFKPVDLGAKATRRDRQQAPQHRRDQRRRHRAGHRPEAEGRGGDLLVALGPPRQARSAGPAGPHLERRDRQRLRQRRAAGDGAGGGQASRRKRTQIFLWPAAEEQGLIGATGYTRNPIWPLAKTAADLNLDSLNFVGRTRDIGVAGSERSSLHASAAKVAKAMGLRLAPTVPDLGGAYFRADHFAFAKAGVPAFNVGSAVFSGDGSFDFEHDHAASSQKMVGFTKHYHQVSDEYNPAWDLSGMVQQAQFTLNLGYEVANAPAMPTWNKGEAFGAVKR